MDRRELDGLLDLWARWVINGHMVDRRGFMSESFGSSSGGGGSSCVMANDALETRIEAAVSMLGTTNKRAELVLRVDFGIAAAAGWRECPRLQAEKAVRLGINLNQYRRALTRAKEHVWRTLEAHRVSRKLPKV